MRIFLDSLDPGRWDGCVVPKRRFETTILSVKSQQRVDLIYTAVEARSHALLETHSSVLQTETWVVVEDAYAIVKYE
jgi:hypothetical protein